MSTSKPTYPKFFYALAALFILSYIILLFTPMHHPGGCLLMCSFTSLAIAFRGNTLLKGFSFTVMIFAAVSLAMYYPQYFIGVGGFKFASLIVPLLQLIMFGMGTELSLIKIFNRCSACPKASSWV